MPLSEEFWKHTIERLSATRAPDQQLTTTWYSAPCPFFVAKMTIYGSLLGFTCGSFGYMVDSRKYYTTLLEDLAAPQQKITVARTSPLYLLAKRTIVISSMFGKGAIHGALYGASNCFFKGQDFSDRSANFFSGLVFAVSGRYIWAGGSAWYHYGLIAACLSAILTFKNDFLMLDDVGITPEQARRARKRMDEKAEFIKDRLAERALYKDIYLEKHPEVDPEIFSFYSTKSLPKKV